MKVFIAAIMVGIGWVIAQFPEIWKWLTYLIPTISVCMLFGCIVKLLRSVK